MATRDFIDAFLVQVLFGATIHGYQSISKIGNGMTHKTISIEPFVKRHFTKKEKFDF